MAGHVGQSLRSSRMMGMSYAMTVSIAAMSSWILPKVLTLTSSVT